LPAAGANDLTAGPVRLFLDGVGWSHPLRYVVEQNGYGEEP